MTFKQKVQAKTKRVVGNAVKTAKLKKGENKSYDTDFYFVERETEYVTRSSGLYDNYRATVGYDNEWN